MLCKLLLIEKPQTTLQNKQTTVQSYQKMSNQNRKKNPGMKFALFNCTGEKEMDISGYLNSLHYFTFIW